MPTWPLFAPVDGHSYKFGVSFFRFRLYGPPYNQYEGTEALYGAAAYQETLLAWLHAARS